MTPELFQTMSDINSQVNAITYDAAIGVTEGYDEWFDAPGTADAPHSFVCRDYALMKARELRDAGFDPATLSIILCYTELNEYHAVLGVQDGADTWILDNRTPSPYLMSSPPYPYRWERRQIPGTTNYEEIV